MPSTTARPFVPCGSFQKKKDAEVTAKQFNERTDMTFAATKKLPHRGKGSAKFGIIRTA